MVCIVSVVFARVCYVCLCDVLVIYSGDVWSVFVCVACLCVCVLCLCCIV